MNNIALIAVGPQDDYVIDNTVPILKKIEQHTPLSIDQVNIKFGNPPIIANGKHRIAINPRTIGGDLISNMHLSVTLPKLIKGESYCDNIGRALIKSLSLYIDEQLIEYITCDWLVIRDQLFLDEDEKMSLSTIINEGYPVDGDGFKINYASSPHEVELIIPLEFFFCRRHSQYKTENERTTKPFLPLCAMYRQMLYIDIEFNSQEFFTNSSVPVDFAKQPFLIVELITVMPEERLSIQAGTQNIVINKVYKEPISELTTGDGKINFTVNYPVSLTTWFFRRRVFETLDSRFFDNRFQFGYTYTDNSIYKNRDPFQFIRLYINNEDVTPEVGGVLFFKYLQSLNYNMSTPTNEIYMYSFGKNPKEYNTGNTFDFSKVDYKSTFIQFKLDPVIALDVTTNYTLNMYHSGYGVLRFSGGFATLNFI